MTKQTHKRYLGDNVYVSVINNQTCLTTGHHSPEMADNIIFLNPEVLLALHKYHGDLLNVFKENRDDSRDQL